MNITDVKIHKLEGENRIKAYATVIFDDVFIVHNIKLVQGEESFFISMPSRKNSLGKFKDIVHPINNDFRRTLEQAVIKAYEKEE